MIRNAFPLKKSACVGKIPDRGRVPAHSIPLKRNCNRPINNKVKISYHVYLFTVENMHEDEQIETTDDNEHIYRQC